MSVNDFFVILNMTLAFFVDVVFFIADLEVVLIDIIDSLMLLNMSVNSEVVSFNELFKCCINDDERLSLIKTVNQFIFFFIIDIVYFAVFLIKLTKFSLLM